MVHQKRKGNHLAIVNWFNEVRLIRQEVAVLNSNTPFLSLDDIGQDPGDEQPRLPMYHLHLLPSPTGLPGAVTIGTTSHQGKPMFICVLKNRLVKLDQIIHHIS